jgi:hypothetical protein
MHFTHRLETTGRLAIPLRAYGSLGLAPLLVLIALLLAGVAKPAAAGPPKFEFDMVRSLGLPADCVPDAIGHIKIESKGEVEEMNVKVEGLPPNTGFDLFVIQQPGSPFGMSWYQSDLQTNNDGKGQVKVVGRFNIETFMVAPGTTGVPAPTPHDGLDANTNPTTKPIHMYHLGLWFNSPDDGANAKCPGGPTPFNGDHTAGIQVLNTNTFPNLAGPLSNLQ